MARKYREVEQLVEIIQQRHRSGRRIERSEPASV